MIARVWEWWKRFGKKIGDFQARALLFLFYFLILGPFALVVRSVSDPLKMKGNAPPGWGAKDPAHGPTMEGASRQF
ncbi:MAG: hypothetical protein HYV04_22235 [Deltaproteobacteria bacterium]|nr:hypothetical protein [Deltaproteobacteria bacterium]